MTCCHCQIPFRLVNAISYVFVIFTTVEVKQISIFNWGTKFLIFYKLCFRIHILWANAWFRSLYAITKNNIQKQECMLCTQISKVCRLHVTWLLLEDGGATAGKGVHVGRDGVDGHMAGPGSFLNGMVIPHSSWWRVRAGCSCEWVTENRQKKHGAQWHQMSAVPGSITSVWKGLFKVLERAHI